MTLKEMMIPHITLFQVAMDQTMRLIQLKGRKKYRRKILKQAYDYSKNKQ